MSVASEERSVFHVTLDNSAERCSRCVADYAESLERLCGHGTQAAQAFALLLADTPFAEIAGQFHSRSKEMEEAAQIDAKLLRTEAQKQRIDTDVQGMAHGLAQLLQTQLHFFQLAVSQLSHLSQMPLPSHAPQNSTATPSEDAKKSGDSPTRRKKLIPSLFSKLGSKGNAGTAAENSQSAFYVDLDCKVREVKVKDVPKTDTQAEEKPECVGNDLASQEELDLVINMLSKGCPRPPMQAIPELPRKPPVWSPASTVDQSRKNNTWPFKVDSTNWPSKTASQNEMPRWQADGFTDTAKQWSSTADSGSCSDESSSNGEWLLNTAEHMNAAQPPQLVIQHRRRHSSGGENPPGTSSATLGNVTLATPPLNKSIESLLVDTKSTNTWPLKHPWANSSTDAESAHLRPPMHRPLSNQWSDPLSTHLSVWDPGLLGQQHQQQAFPGLPTPMDQYNSRDLRTNKHLFQLNEK